jgi:hypothetical protein
VPTITSTLVALDQLVDVVGGLAGVALVVDLEILDLAAGQLAALLLHVELEALLDRRPERRRCRWPAASGPTLSGRLLGDQAVRGAVTGVMQPETGLKLFDGPVATAFMAQVAQGHHAW